MPQGSTCLESDVNDGTDSINGSNDGSVPIADGTSGIPPPPSPAPPLSPPPGAFNPSAYGDEHVFLALEFLSDAHGRWMVWITRAAVALGTAALAVEIWWRYGSDTQAVLYGSASSIVSVAVAAAGLVAVLTAGALFLRGVVAARSTGKKFGIWRRRYCTLAGLALLFETCSLTFFLTPNIMDLVTSCSWTQLSVQVMSYLRWTSIACLLSLQVVQGLAVMPLSGKMPWGLLLPRTTLIAVFFAAFLPLALVHFFRLALATDWFDTGYMCDKYFGLSCAEVYAESACTSRAFSCVYTSAEVALTSTYVSLAVIVISAYFVLVSMARVRVGRLPYAHRRLVSIELGLQLQARLPAAIFFIVGFIVLGFIRMDSCSSMMLTIMGHPSFQIAMAAVASVQVLLAAPAISDAGHLRLRPWLQEFVWLESEIEEKAAARPPAVRDEPCFCFETCLKCFYFSRLVYRLDDANSPFSVPVALGLYGLNEHTVIWRRKEEAKCLAAWNTAERLLVLAFRGTASMANVAADLELWRREYPEGVGSYWLGTQPMVHRGFLRTWEGSGMKEEVMDLVGGLVSGESGALWRIIVTGHSLGASLASLAAFDMAREWESRIKLTIIGFGPPRTGNVAFARAFSRAVPDAWAVFHGDDVVSQAAKFISLYKREAHVVIVSPQGELVVRPCYAEAALRRGTPSVAMHQLSAYTRSVGAILRNAAGSRPDGRQKSRLPARDDVAAAAAGESKAAPAAAATEFGANDMDVWDIGLETNPAEKEALKKLLTSPFVQAALTRSGAMRQVSVLRVAGASVSMIERAEREEEAEAEAAAVAAAAEDGSLEKPATTANAPSLLVRCGGICGIRRMSGESESRGTLKRALTGVKGAMEEAVALATAAASEVGPLVLNAEEKDMNVED